MGNSTQSNNSVPIFEWDSEMTDIEKYIMETPVLDEYDFPDPDVANLDEDEQPSKQEILSNIGQREYFLE